METSVVDSLQVVEVCPRRSSDLWAVDRAAAAARKAVSVAETEAVHQDLSEIGCPGVAVAVDHRAAGTEAEDHPLDRCSPVAVEGIEGVDPSPVEGHPVEEGEEAGLAGSPEMVDLVLPMDRVLSVILVFLEFDGENDCVYCYKKLGFFSEISCLFHVCIYF